MRRAGYRTHSPAPLFQLCASQGTSLRVRVYLYEVQKKIFFFVVRKCGTKGAKIYTENTYGKGFWSKSRAVLEVHRDRSGGTEGTEVDDRIPSGFAHRACSVELAGEDRTRSRVLDPGIRADKLTSPSKPRTQRNRKKRDRFFFKIIFSR